RWWRASMASKGGSDPWPPPREGRQGGSGGRPFSWARSYREGSGAPEAGRLGGELVEASRRGSEEGGQARDVVRRRLEALLLEEPVHELEVEDHPRGKERERLLFPRVEVVPAVRDLAAEDAAPRRGCRRRRQDVRTDEGPRLAVRRARREGDRGGLRDVADVHAREADVAEGLRVDVIPEHGVFVPGVVLEEVVRPEDRERDSGGLERRFDRQLRPEVREVGRLVHAVDGEVDDFLHTGHPHAVHGHEALVTLGRA